MSIKELLTGLKPSQLWAAVVAVAGIIALAFSSGYWLGSHLRPSKKTTSQQQIVDPQASPPSTSTPTVQH